MGIILSDHNHLILVPFWAIATKDYHVTGTKLHILYDGSFCTGCPPSHVNYNIVKNKPWVYNIFYY